MPIKRAVDEPCGQCGERPTLSFHEGGSIRGAAHACLKAPPGPVDPPRVYLRGQHWPATNDRSAKVRPESEWHEDDGPALWWQFPVCEPPYVGTPLDSDWPGYHTHWTPIVVPATPARAVDSAVVRDA